MNVELKSLKKANVEKTYNAFSDLKYFKGQYWLTFRSGKGHVSPEGKICIYNSTDAENWNKFQVISRDKTDLRDPKFALVNDELILICFSLDYYKDTSKRFIPSDSYFYKLKEGNFILEGVFEYEKHRNLIWSMITIQNKIIIQGYGHDKDNYVANLWESDSIKGPWTKIHTLPSDLIPDIMRFTEISMVKKGDKNLVLFCRTDKKPKEANLSKFKIFKDNWFIVAQSEYPFNEWNYKTHRLYLKGPAAIHFKDEDFFFVGRFKEKLRHKFRKISFFHYDDDFRHKFDFAKGMDGSYAGMIWNPKDKNELIISFYSDHEVIKSLHSGKYNEIWIAKVSIS